jgi:tetratricopeptide (TPR) repeat protein
MHVLVLAMAQDKKAAARFFEMQHFEAALEEYALLVDKHPTDPLFNYRLGICYLNTDIDKSKAIPYLEKVTSLTQYDPNALYLLGRAYHYNYEFDKAIIAFSRFIELGAGNLNNLKDAGLQIEYCQNAKELQKYPVNVSFENLGPSINTVYSEYLPFVPVDESFLIFTSRRNEHALRKSNGELYADVYIAPSVNGKFTSAQPLSGLHDENMEEAVVGLSNDGKVAIAYMEIPGAESDLRFALIGEKQVLRVIPLDPKINSKYTEISATLSADSTAIYFSSDMPGGFGGMDLYICRMLPTGKWSVPQNLGPFVNTIRNEDFPSISPDGTTLYFSSDGHTSVGGYDIFKAEFNEEKQRFMSVRNLGMPINTPDDDMNLRMSENGRHGYLSCLRPEGRGGLDIYRLVFLEEEPQYTVVKGAIKRSDNGQFPEGVFITVSRSSNGELFGEYQANQRSGKYVIILPPGKYDLFAEAEGFEGWSTQIEILGQDAFVFEKELDILMQPNP